MTRHSIPTGPAVSVEDAPREGNFLDICNRTNMIPFQQTKTNEFIPPPRFIVEDHPEAYNNRYAMESESENENEENQTYTTYPAGETLINTSHNISHKKLIIQLLRLLSLGYKKTVMT
uniref:Uncharacterized protein n=1 Tax=Brassica oleracea TaxID=3712 RepID=A0A3P6F251_BRAOL|nr:unnamed protein product [Brassica oleracea]